jgi:predicted TIM-barrel enzyme
MEERRQPARPAFHPPSIPCEAERMRCSGRAALIGLAAAAAEVDSILDHALEVVVSVAAIMFLVAAGVR